MNDEYIKMILALSDEFFDGWEWKEGDAFLYRPTPEDEWEIYHIGSFGTMVNDGVIVFATLIENATPSQGEYRPVPSQEQLQKIILNYYSNNGLDIKGRENLYLLWRFQEWLRDQTFEECAGLTIKELLLLFLMYVIYNKRWNGDHWL